MRHRYMRKMLTMGIAVAAMSILTACGGDANADTSEKDPPKQSAAEQVENSDPAKVWGKYKTTKIVGGDKDVKALFADTSVAVTFHEDTGVTIAAPCNGMSGPVTLDGGTLVVGGTGLTQTMIGCPDERQDQDEFLSEFFRSEPKWELAGTTLTLSSSVGTVTLERSGE